MNSFTLTAVGQLARNPELVARGDVAYTRFCLVGTDYAGKDDEGAAREVVTTLWFVAFGALGEAVARHSRKGDQLIVEARVRANIWTDKQGDKQYDHSFVVQGFRFGAPGRMKREERDARREEGHGLHRLEDRTQARDRNAGGGAYAGVGAHGGFGVAARVGARNGVTSNAGPANREESGGGSESGSGESSRAPHSRGVDDLAAPNESPGGDRPVEVDETAEVVDGAGAGGSAEVVGGTGADDSAEVVGGAGAGAPAEVAGGGLGADGSSGTGGGASADESAGAPGDVSAEETAGNDSHATRSGKDRTSHAVGGVAKDASRDAVKSASRVSGTRAATTRAREKSGGSRSGRRASASAA